MAKKIKKSDMDEQLLNSIFRLESEWKQISSLLEQSIDRPAHAVNIEALAQANYLFLLREARHRKVSAMSYR
ncbi:YaaL family protein [Oceanobacillus manasiensis]|uniref:YaaL family protein n=1 Tax=Oceanobacillus manasiensis TaxID=586413 RepID=UPI0005A72261|nr:YaaL family protein [Oceanobacillus manasiensis]